MTITIWHNPRCGPSRNVLAMIRAVGEAPAIRLYLEDPPSRAELDAALARTGLTPRALLRRKGTPHDELGLEDPALGDDVLLAAMLAHPILINRPLVFAPAGARLCRPSETVLDLLPRPLPPGFLKEDGTPPAHG